ncbi:dihydrofolate reductase family protein [Antarctobacter jejuensis]|uniref:dihydrofolate reductase family protein n=1 Tax=Antarctobacter jejuensis TaxID=1439938 RepID=UPI003FD3ADB9
MITGHVFIAMSLDGYIAREDGGLDWLMKQDTAGEDHGYNAFIARMDGLVMGSNTFRTVLNFDAWPYDLPVVVASQTMTEDDIPAALRDRVSLSRAEPANLMTDLAARGWQRAYIDGGALIQSFLRAGLIADMTVTLIPILLGAGRPLFGPLVTDLDLSLEEVRSFPSGLISTRYAIPSPTIAKDA